MNSGAASRDSSVVLDEAASRKAIEAIWRAAVDGLLALPRVGVGVGGLLVGVKRDGRIQILDRIEIPCSHARGPGFLLTAEELAEAADLAAVAEPLEVLGIYLSKTRGGMELTEHDREVFESLCPGTGRIALVIRPSTVEPVWANIFVRAPHGGLDAARKIKLDRESPAIDLPETVAEEIPHPNPALQALKLAAAAARPEPLIEDQRLGQTSPPRITPASTPSPGMPVVESPPSLPRPVAPPPRNAVLFREPASAESSRRSFAFAAGALVLIGAAIAFLERDFWLPPPELSLTAADENGQLVFRWRREAVAGAERGRLMVSDAGRLSEFSLDAGRLRTGVFRYSRKSDQVVAKLVVGDHAARAVFFGNSPRAQK
jgi:hypothetical protein